MKTKYIVISVGIATALWIAHPLLLTNKTEETSHPVRVYERDIETEVHGEEPETEFEPGIEMGGLIISPESDYYNNLELMARVVEAEAGNQGLLGKRMVVDVILNRARDKDFPNTIAEVIYQKNAFSVINNGMYERVEISEETWDAVFTEIKEITYPNLFYFCSNGYSEYGTPWDKVGDHYFSTK